MSDVPAPFDLDRLTGLAVPFRLHFVPEVGSTSDLAAALLARGGLTAPAVVAASRQTAGRGTRGRTWHSGQGSLTATFVLPIRDGLPVQHLPLLAGLAVRSALAGLAPAGAFTIKWPNDLLLAGRKVAGLLCERKHGADLVGVGLNVALGDLDLPENVRVATASLADAGACCDRWVVLGAIARSFAMRLLAPEAPAWPQASSDWAAHDALAGRRISVEVPTGLIHGRSAGVDGDGRLLVIDGAGGLHAIASGSVRVAPPGVEGAR